MLIKHVGPHIGVTNAWPMSLLMQIQTSDDDGEIQECLELVLDSARLGLMHESIDVNHITSYTSELLSMGRRRDRGW